MRCAVRKEGRTESPVDMYFKNQDWPVVMHAF